MSQPTQPSTVATIPTTDPKRLLAADLAEAGYEVEASVRELQQIMLADHAFKVGIKSPELREVKAAMEIVTSRLNIVKPPKQISPADRATLIIDLSDFNGPSPTVKVTIATPDVNADNTPTITIDGTPDPDDLDALGPTPAHISAAGETTIFDTMPEADRAPQPTQTLTRSQEEIDMEELLASFVPLVKRAPPPPPRPAEMTIKVTNAELDAARQAKEDRIKATQGVRDIKMPEVGIAMNRHFGAL